MKAHMHMGEPWAGQGIKWTRQREALLRILTEAARPLTAAEIHDIYRGREENAWISTTYRTLELFTTKGIANKIILTGHDSVFYELNRHDHRHYAVCRGCNAMIDLQECPVDDLNVKTKTGDFHVTGHRLEVYGYCGDCYQKQKREK